MNRQLQAAAVDTSPLTTQDLVQLITSPIRREILLALVEKGKDVSTLARELDLDIRSISHFLIQLKTHGLVVADQVRRRHVYSLTELAQAGCDNGSVFVRLTVSREIFVEIRRP